MIIIIIGTDSVLWPCTTDNDCSTVTDAKCTKYHFYCYCPAGYVLSSDVTECIKESPYGGSCKDPVQCSHMVISSMKHFI